MTYKTAKIDLHYIAVKEFAMKTKESGKTASASKKEYEKIPMSQVKKLPYKTLNRLINKAKNYLKADESWKKLCDKYETDVNIIDFIPTMFGNLEVSAKTDHGIIILNYRLLCDGNFTEDYSYLIHEYTHWFQQCFGEKSTKSSDDGSYLDNIYEQEGFSNQIEYIANNQGESKAEEYVDDLLDHHEIDNKNKRDELESIFLEKV